MKFALLFIVTFIYFNEASKLLDKFRDSGDKVWNKYNEKVPKNLNPFKLLYRKCCIADLGCFYSGPPFHHPIHRPISVCPSKRVHKIRFLLFVPEHPTKVFEMKADPVSIETSNFDPEKDTKIVVHGSLALLDKKDVRVRIKDALLEKKTFNVIIVDWTALNSFPYFRSVANTRVVGAQLAKLIQLLIDTTGVTAESFHIIGHSFGAQIAGYAGERITNLGRITGLDPAGSYFRDTEPEVRLDPSDAIFVDAIHTNGADLFTGGFGMNPPVGDMDFYPNGGKHQPGCVYTSSIFFIGKAINATAQNLNMPCDHDRANLYFLESIDNSECKFLAMQCANYTQFEKGLCQKKNSHVSEMGFHSKKIRKLEFPTKFYLRTNRELPFCNQNSYKIKAPKDWIINPYDVVFGLFEVFK